MFDTNSDLVYEWGRLFASPWEHIVRSMAARASENGLAQTAGPRRLDWMAGPDITVRFIFVDDPSDFDAVRQIYTEESNASIPACFVIVRQPDESDTRGEIIFDIFRLSPKSYLWHFHRVYTRPAGEGAT